MTNSGKKMVITWQLMWLNLKVATLNATLQLLVLYRLDKEQSICQERATSLEIVSNRVIGLDFIK